MPETQNVNVLGRVAFKFAESWELALTGSYFASEVAAGHAADERPRRFASPATRSSGSYVPLPYISPAITAYTVPATYPGNTFGTPANVRAIVPASPRRTASIRRLLAWSPR